MAPIRLTLITFVLLFLFIRGSNKNSSLLDSNVFEDFIEKVSWEESVADSINISKGALIIAFNEFESLRAKGSGINDSIITIIDFSKPSSEERFFVFDIKNKKLLVSSLVAHGKKSGLVYAENFSNTPKSNMSSLGMFITDNTYEGKHGYSLRLNGINKGLNDNARIRAIVVHGASYVSTNYLKTNGRLGRSFGCPALPYDKNKEIIDMIKEGSCFYIYHPSLKTI